MILRTLPKLALALGLLAPIASEAAPLGPTVLVFPFEGKGKPIGDVGLALQLRAIGTVRAVRTLGEINEKMQYRVVQQAEARLAELDTDARRRAISREFGAQIIVYGEVTEAKDKLSIDLYLLKSNENGQSPETTHVDAANLADAAGMLPGRIVELLGKAGVAAAIPDGVRVSPMTNHSGALLEYASCTRRVMEQPIGLLNPVVLDTTTIDEATDACSTALALDKSFVDAESTLALIDALAGRQKRAESRIAKLKSVTELVPNLEVAKFWLLNRFYGTDEAVSSLAKVVENNPGFLLGRGYLGDAYTALGDFDGAIKVFQDYLASVPNQPWVMARIGYNFAKKGDVEAGIDWTQRALKAAPSDSEVLLELGSRFIDAKRFKDAITIFRRIIGDGGARGEVHLRLGFAYFLDGEYGLAERSFHEAIRLAAAPSEWRTRGRARYDLAKLWMRFDAPDVALRALRQALDEGFRDQVALTSDPDFAKLSGNPEFKKLLKLAAKSTRRPNQLSPFDVDPTTGEQKAERTHAKKKIPF